MKAIKKLALCFVAFAVMVTSFGGLSTTQVDAAPAVKSVTVPVMNNVSGMDKDGFKACYTQTATIPVDGSTTSYFKFTLKSDSWVIFKGNYSLYNHDGVGTDVAIYSDSAYSNKKLEFKWGYWRGAKPGLGFMKKGTYYASVRTEHENYQDPYEGNINIIGAAIPLDKVFNYKVTTNKTKTYANITMSAALGEYTDNVQYRKGSVGLANVGNKQYWKQKLSGMYFYGDGAKLLTVKGGNKYTVKVTKNASYTFMVEDTNGNRYSKVIKVNKIDKTKPVVTGVKNNKTYKKTVRIKFSDKQTGIKSATLNGKKFKSNKTVSKKGTYKLIVTDKAGNKTTIKFKIKK